MGKYNFEKNANRWNYYERRYDDEYNETTYHLKKQGHPVVNFGIADINYQAPDPVWKAIQTRAEKGTYSYSYVPKRTYQAIQSWYEKTHHHKVKIDWIKIAHGTVNAMNQVVQAFSEIGDYVLIQTPIYKPFGDAILINQRKVANNQLIYDSVNQTYEVDFADFEEQIVTKKIKLFMLCSPHNPGAVVWSFETFKKMVEICEKYQVLIFADEVHSDMVFKSFTSILKFDYNQFILAGSPNKVFNLGGLKASYLIIKDQKIKTKIEIQYQKNYLTSLNVFVNGAFQEAYLNPESSQWLAALKDHIWKNFTYLKPELEKLGFLVFDLQSTYLVWVKCPNGFDAQKLSAKLKIEDHIVLCDSTDFYGADSSFFRINIASSQDDLKYLISCLKKKIISEF